MLVTSALAAGAILAGTASAQAQSRHYNTVDLRVTGLAGGETLTMRSRPSKYGRIVTRIPFNARYITPTYRERRGRWQHLRYQGNSGWVYRKNLVTDNGGATVYRAALGGNRELKIHRRPNKYSRVRGVIPNRAKDVFSAGRCEGAWCKIRYRGVRGWVQKHCLIVTRSVPEDWRRRRNDDYELSGDRRNYRRGYGQNRRYDSWRNKVRRWRSRNIDYRYYR